MLNETNSPRWTPGGSRPSGILIGRFYHTIDASLGKTALGRCQQRDKSLNLGHVTIFARAVSGFLPIRLSKPFAAPLPNTATMVRPRIDYPLCGADEYLDKARRLAPWIIAEAF
jgi:hypothetical protein